MDAKTEGKNWRTLREFLGFADLSDDDLLHVLELLHGAAVLAQRQDAAGVAEAVGRLGMLVAIEGDGRGLSGPTPEEIKAALESIEKSS